MRDNIKIKSTLLTSNFVVVYNVQIRFIDGLKAGEWSEPLYARTGDIVSRKDNKYFLNQFIANKKQTIYFESASSEFC